MNAVRLTSQACHGVILLLVTGAVGNAQADTGPVLCTGQQVSRVGIRAAAPPFSGAAQRWQTAARRVGLHHAVTQDRIVSAFLLLSAGQPCSEFRRAESERVLRAQPFLADAAVRFVPDSGGTVALVVRTTDEVPVLIGARFRGVTPESFLIGNQNLGGLALHLQGRVESGGAYRTGYGAHLEQDAFLGRPYRLIVDGDRFRVGQQVRVELEHPIFTSLQRIAWHVGAFTRDSYIGFVRPAHDALVLQARDQSWDASVLWRLFGTGSVALLGVAVSGRTFDPAAAGLVMDDTGFRADTGIALQRRYQAFRTTRVGVTGGLRLVTFQTMRGFDALVGAQDVASGVTAGVFVGRGLSPFGVADLFLSGALYSGATWPHGLLAATAQAEGRRDPDTREWESVIGSGRMALYQGTAPGMVLVLANEFSGGSNARLPLQLTFGDPVGGLMGYRASALAGARRNVTRAELRWSASSLFRGADAGIAAFTEVGTLWAGDAPYGVNATRASAGVSLLAAYPSHSKRLYRADVAIPVSRTGGGRLEIRLSSADRTQAFWSEPSDVARARTGAEPARLFAWPSR